MDFEANNGVLRTRYRAPETPAVYEVTKPFTSGMKGARHTNCLYEVCRLGARSGGNTWAELAPTRRREPSQGCRPNLQAVVRKRMMQPREIRSGVCNWESPIEG